MCLESDENLDSFCVQVTKLEQVMGELTYAQTREEPLSRLALKLTQLLEAHTLLQVWANVPTSEAAICYLLEVLSGHS